MDNANIMDTRKRRKEGASRAPSLESLQASPKRARVHAQRKFAQGSQPNSPAPTPVKETRELRDRTTSADSRTRSSTQQNSTPPPSLDLLEVPMRPTVEDFLTFLCYRGTPLLPPELEHFNTPQLMETAGDSRSQSPTRDDKLRTSARKNQQGLYEKKERELSKEAIKKNLDHAADEIDTATPVLRVTRSSTYVPSPSDQQQQTPPKVSRMIKKALLLRSKAKTLRIQDRRERSLGKKHTDLSNHQGGVIATRSGRLLNKYRVSATTAMARKKARVAKLSSMRPKQKLSRILQRLGSVSHPDAKVQRITRSQVEPKEVVGNEETSPETQASELTPVTSSSGDSPDKEATPKASRSLRLLRQRSNGKKVIIKKLVRVNQKDPETSVRTINSPCKSHPLSEDNVSPSSTEENTSLSRRLRKKSVVATTSPENPNGLSSSSNAPVANDLIPDIYFKESTTPEGKPTRRSMGLPSSPLPVKKLSDTNSNQRKPDISPKATSQVVTESPTVTPESGRTRPQRNLTKTSLPESLGPKANGNIDSIKNPSAPSSTIQNPNTTLESKKCISVDDSKRSARSEIKNSGKGELVDNLKKVSAGAASNTNDREDFNLAEQEISSKPSPPVSRRTSRASSSASTPSLENKPISKKVSNTPQKVSSVSEVKPRTRSTEKDSSTEDSPVKSIESNQSKVSSVPNKEMISNSSIQENNLYISNVSFDDDDDDDIPEGKLEIVCDEDSDGSDDLSESTSLKNSKENSGKETSSEKKDSFLLSQPKNDVSPKPEKTSQDKPMQSKGTPPLESIEPSVGADANKQTSLKTSPTKSASEVSVLLGNKKETRQIKDSQAATQDSGITSSTKDEANLETGLRSRPSRRTKEAATVYLELISRKLAKESKPKGFHHHKVNSDQYQDDEDDGDDDDDAVSVSSILDLKDLAKSKGRESEKERKEKISSWNIDPSSEAIDEYPDSEPSPQKSSSVNSISHTTRKSPRSKREGLEQSAKEDKGAKRKSSNEESDNASQESKPVGFTKTKRKWWKEDSSSTERLDAKASTKDSALLDEGHHTSLVMKRFPRNLRRTRSDAEEPKRKGSSSRRSSLEVDFFSNNAKSKQGRSKFYQFLGENSCSDTDEGKESCAGDTLSDSSKLHCSKEKQLDQKNTSNQRDCNNTPPSDKEVSNEQNRSDNVINVGEVRLFYGKSERVASDKEKKTEKTDKGQEAPSISAVSKGITQEPSTTTNLVITGKTHRSVLQDRKSRKSTFKEEGRYMPRRKSQERVQGKVSTNGSGDNNTQEKKATRPLGRGKLIGGRRRNSNHDEAKLNEVLESVAKDFEKDIDEEHYDQIEKDFASGNKSPDKGISDKMIELSEKEDSNLSEFINFCMDDKISYSNLEALTTSSGSTKATSGFSISQAGRSSPSLAKRSASGKKLSDVVRSLQRKQAESPNSTSGPTENPTFLKDLNTWNADKLRQVSPLQSGYFHLESPTTTITTTTTCSSSSSSFSSTSSSSAPKVISQVDASMPEIVHNPPAAPTTATTTSTPLPPSPLLPPPPTPPPLPLPQQLSAPPALPDVLTSKAPSPVPDKPYCPKMAVTKSVCIGAPLTTSPVTSHSSPSVATVTTSCLQANAPYTAVTFSASYNVPVVHTSSAHLATPALACDILNVNTVSKSTTLKPLQTSKDEQVTVLSSIPVAINPSHPPPLSLNVLNSGFSPTAVSGLPMLPSSVTLSSHCTNVVAKPAVELTSQKSSPKQLHIAPKPTRPSTPLASATLANQMAAQAMLPGGLKQMPKPVQIAPKPSPSSSSTHLHHNSQILTHQPTCLMQAQVQNPMQAVSQQIQGMKAMPQAAVQTVAALTQQPVQNMQTALTQTVQTMPVQNMSTIPQAVQSRPQPLQTIQGGPLPPIQTVTGVPVQAVITQTMINPTHMVTSPHVTSASTGRMINQPVFATSSNQSNVTYSLSPHPNIQTQSQGSIGPVSRVLTPAVVGKIAPRPPTNIPASKTPQSHVAIAPGTLSNSATVRPITTMPQPVQVSQSPILAVNYLPVASNSVVDQSGMIARPIIGQQSHVSGNHAYVPPTTMSNDISIQTHSPSSFPQNSSQRTSASYNSHTNPTVTPHTMQSSGINATLPPQRNIVHSPSSIHNEVPGGNQRIRPSISSNPSNVNMPVNTKLTPNPKSSGSIPVHNKADFVPKSNVDVSISVETLNSSVGVTDKRMGSVAATNAYMEAAFKSVAQGNARISEPSKMNSKANGPVSAFDHPKGPSRIPAAVKSQIASSSITITALSEVSQATGANATHSTKSTTSASPDYGIKFPTGVSVVHHKAGSNRMVTRNPDQNVIGPPSSVAQTVVENESRSVQPIIEKSRRVMPTPLNKDDVFISTAGPRHHREMLMNQNLKNEIACQSQFRSNKEIPSVSANAACNDKKSASHLPLAQSHEPAAKPSDRMVGVSDKTLGEFDKRNADKRKEPLLKRTLFKTKSQEERRPSKPSPVNRTKSQDDKKPSGAFSPLHESSVYAFDEIDQDALDSPFSQRIKNIQSSPCTSPVKPTCPARPLNPTVPVVSKSAGRGTTNPRGPVARSITPLITGRGKSTPISSASAFPQPLPVGKKISNPKAVSTGTDTSLSGNKTDTSVGGNKNDTAVGGNKTDTSVGGNKTETSVLGNKTDTFVSGNKTDSATETAGDQTKVSADSNQASETSDNVKKNSNSTSIAIQCDMDENMVDESVRANESGTQTEGPSKFPLPPSASPFYYLPLAMAALGEKLPAQLVQQMLAKTQGLVGAAEAGMILQQAAQLAQQHQQKLAQEGTPGPCIPSSSASVKPIKPASVAPLISGLTGNPSMTNVNPLRSVSKYQDPSQSSNETTLALATPSTLDGSVATASNTVTVSSSESVTVSSPCIVTAPSQVTSTVSPIVTTVTQTTTTSVSCSVTSSISESVSNADPPPSYIPPHRPQPTTSISSSEETASALADKSKLEPKRKRKSQNVDTSKDHSDDTDTPPTRRRSGRATTLAATRATESDMHEIEELRRNRKAKRVAAALAREEGWSSSSEAPLSPQMSPDTLRGWPPPRLTSPTPSQSSEGTTSSTPSQRGNRLSASRSRRQSPASTYDSRIHVSSSYVSNSNTSQASSSYSTPMTPDKNLEESISKVCDNSLLVRAPSFYPSEEEFSDPLDYIEKIRPEAEQFGLCRIVPPSSFKPECRVNDDMRFTSNNQYIHKMMKRWGPNVRTLHAIRRCLSRQNIELTSNPLIGCMELDLVRLYEVVEQHGGLMSVIEKDQWGKVADACRIPRSAQERLTKLDSIYCKYLLPYATLSTDERSQLLAEVDAMHSRNRGEIPPGRRTSSVMSDIEDEDDEESLDCIVKGKSTALSTFYRVARNISSQWQPDPNGLEVDERYWSVLVNGAHHVCVLSASIDTSEHAYGFPNHRNSPLAKHPWNLKNLCQNTNSVLRSMGTIVGVTAPTLHVGMLFSTVCWYRDPHGLPWIEYLHTGASKIWYGVAANQEEKLNAALKKIVPDFIKDSAIWLPSDTAMVPPTELVREGVRVCRVVQDPGQFVVVFPGAFTSSICKGYLISESAFFARPQYFDRAVASFKALHDCCEPSMFSLDRLVLSVVSDPRATLDGLLRARDLVIQVVEKEKKLRAQLSDIGLELSERLSTPDSHRKKKSRFLEDEEENMCEVCRQNIYVALVTNSQEEAVYCLEHALSFLSKNPSHLEYCKLMYTYSLSELDSAIKQMDEKIHTKSGSKKSPYGKKSKTREHLDSFSSSTSSSNL